MRDKLHDISIPGSDLLVALSNGIKEGAAIIEKSSGEVIFCNASLCSMFGIDSRSKLSITDFALRRKPPLGNNELLFRVGEAEGHGVYREQTEFISLTGKSFWVDLTIRAFVSKRKTFLLFILDPIDSIKETELKISQDRKRYRAILEHASMGIIEANDQGKIVAVNKFAESLFKYKKNELVGANIELLIPSRFHSNHVIHRTQYARNPKSRPMGVGIDLYAIKKNGTEFPVEVSLSSYKRNGNHNIIAFVSDISIRKKSELEIKKLNDDLEETVDQRTAQLKTAITQLEKSKDELSRLLEKEKELGELKSRFVSMASHEFRTPLSTILSSAYLLEQYNTGEQRFKREKHLKRIISSVNMLTDILNDFLCVGKIEEGKIVVKNSAFDIHQFALTTIEEIRNNLKQQQTINLVHAGAPMVEMDASLLKHIILNLISNASKFSPDDGVININIETNTSAVTISVKDNGIGISKNDQQHLTERFFRGTNVANIQGTGLGLHLVAKYAELMNGTVKCRSELDYGTEFTITFNKEHLV
ncbi:sensor histidine kinase [Pollutibacter soli]|uniref:sensor histidine kinase n=1 Tax=Pollutibacter soli TaxID=3034157 RepID=UPI00301406F1